MNTLKYLCAPGLVAVFLLVSSAPAEGPVLTAVPASGLTAEHRKAIDGYVKYWTTALATTNSAKRIIEVRTMLMRGYRGKGAEYQDAYAGSMGVHGKAALTGQIPAGDKLASLKEVNLAISVNRLGRASLLPLAETMVLHKNPAVRYFAWNAYALLRAPLLAEGGKDLQAMYAAIAKAAAKERDPLVLAEAMRTLHLRPGPSQGVSQEAHRDAQSKSFTILRANWTDLCRRVLSVDAGMADAAASGVNTIEALALALDEPGVGKAALQMVLNVAWCAGKAFDASGQMMRAAEAVAEAEKAAGGKDDAAAAKAAALAAKLAREFGKTPEALADREGDIEEAFSANVLLLRQCEEALNALTGKGQPGERHIRKPLADSGSASDSGAAVQLGVLKWMDELVKKHGLKHPKGLVTAKPATAPSTKPAAAGKKAAKPA